LADGADINALDIDGKTALMRAASKGHTETVNLLLDHEALTLMPKTNMAHTALIEAAINGHTEIVNLLLEPRR
jgi:ankyrin repeat protein